MRRLFVLLLLILPLLVVACESGGNKSPWMGFVYPNRNNLLIYENIGTFRNLKECRDASIARLEELGPLSRGDYECGKDCKPSKYSDAFICEETLR